MNRKYRLLSVIAIIIGLVILPQITSIIAPHLPKTECEGDVACIVDNEFEKMGKQPSIDIMSFNNKVSSSQIELYLNGTPILDHSHGYRIIINWNGHLNRGWIGNWTHIYWDFVIPPSSNITLCFAGGISGFGVTNGSYNRICNSSGIPIFTEMNNDSVSIVGNSIIFPFNQTLITTSKNPYDILVLTTYNTTRLEINEDNTTTLLAITWMDSMKDHFIINLFTLVTLDNKINFAVFMTTLVFIGVSQVIYLKRRRK